MTSASGSSKNSTLHDYLQVVQRRKWLIVQALVLVPLAALVFSLRQHHVYQASSGVLLSNQSLTSQLSGTIDPSAYQQPDRFAQTQADLAHVPIVAERTLRALGLHNRSAQDLLKNYSASPRSNANLLQIAASDRDPKTAVALANTLANQYVLYKSEIDRSQLVRARSDVARKLAALEAAGKKNTAFYDRLVQSDQQLQTMEALQTPPVVVRTAVRADQVQPRTPRNIVLGLALGLVLGIGLAFLWEALDTRVRSAEEIGERLGMPLLARLPAPSKRLRGDDLLVMLEEPYDSDSEPFRMLATNLDFVNLGRSARTLMVTSAVEAEGKSTTAANLAIALARAGRHVVLVDLDLRRPYLHRFFDLEGRAGVTHVALGRVLLQEALVQIPLGELGDAHGQGGGMLEVLPTGPLPPNAGEFAAGAALTEIMQRLSGHADIVIVDTPPMLQVGDAMAMSAKVDGVIVVTRLSVARRGILDEVRRLLDTAPTQKLGFVLTEAEAEGGYGASYYYRAYGEREPVEP
jgi:succinoglycan biosynthesis transport protein ExoP